MSKNAALRYLLYSGDLLAVDLGSFSVKLLSMKAKERGLAVVDSAVREVRRELAAAKSEEEKAEVYARAVRELLAGRAFKPRNASVSLSGNTVIVRFLALPAGYTPPPDGGLPPAARAIVPFEENESVVSALPLEGPGEMMLMISRKATVQGGMDIVRRAGLRPAVIVTDSVALANAWQFFEGHRAGETAVLAGIGASSTSIVVLESGVQRAARVVNIAGGTFTRAVKREFGSDFDEAERLKIAHGLSAPGGRAPESEAEAARVAAALKPPVKDLAAEIQRTIDAFLDRRPAGYPPIRKLFLAGGSAELSGLAGRLELDTGLSVEVFRPAGVPAAFVGPCGLALSNALQRSARQPRVNLVPRKARRSAILRDVSHGFRRRFAAPLLAALLVSGYACWAVEVADGDTVMEQRLAAVAREEAQLKLRFAKKKEAAKPAPKREVNPFAFLSRLTVSGVFGDRRNSLVMLDGDGTVFVARNGRLYDGNEQEVRGVRSDLRESSLALTANGRLYAIELPK